MIYEITPDIKFVGVDDLDIDLFESQYEVPEGMSYNSYVILDDKVAIMDTVDGRKAEAWWQNVRESLGKRQPDYLVLHHLEPDHASLVAEVLAAYPQVKVVASTKALQMLPQFFEDICLDGRSIEVKEGNELPLGHHTLRFFMAPMVHWPEVMVSYEETEQVVFCADAFGKFGALGLHEENASPVAATTEGWACEARRYYFNICGKYGLQVQALLKKLATLEVKKLLPLHGPVLVQQLDYYIGLYNTWSRYEVETPGAFVAYASFHGGTREAAECLAEVLREKGCPKVAVADLNRSDIHECVEDAFRMDTLVLAAASYDAGVAPIMADFLHHLKMKNFQNRRIAIVENGSWAPTAARTMRTMLEGMKNLEVIEPVVTIRSRMKRADLPQIEALADAIVRA